MVKETTPGAVGATVQSTGWSKIAWETATENFLDQCRGFEHAMIPNRQQ